MVNVSLLMKVHQQNLHNRKTHSDAGHCTDECDLVQAEAKRPLVCGELTRAETICFFKSFFYYHVHTVLSYLTETLPPDCLPNSYKLATL